MYSCAFKGLAVYGLRFKPHWAAFSAVWLVTYEVVHGVLLWEFLAGLWRANINANIWQNISDSIAVLICLIISVQNTWNHLLFTHCISNEVSNQKLI